MTRRPLFILVAIGVGFLLAACSPKKEASDAILSLQQKSSAIADRSLAMASLPLPPAAVPLNTANLADARSMAAIAARALIAVGLTLDPIPQWLTALKWVGLIVLSGLVVFLGVYFWPLAHRLLVSIGLLIPTPTASHVKLGSELLAAIDSKDHAAIESSATTLIASQRANDPILDAAWRHRSRKASRLARKKKGPSNP